MALLEVRDVKKYFPVQKGIVAQLIVREKKYVRAVDGVSFNIERGEVMGLVGESGSGKTTLGRMCVCLTRPTAGTILFDNIDISKLNGTRLRRFRRRIQFTFQDPTSSLNPRMRVGDAIADALRLQGVDSVEELRENTQDTRRERKSSVMRLLHPRITPAQRERAYEMLELVGLSPASSFYDRLPHQLSGGQKQRVVFARALALEPEFVVTDEPVAMVDVSIKAQILELMLELKRRLGLTYLFVSHDLATARHICDRIAVMYLGKIVEIAGSKEIYDAPLHQYSIGLMRAIPIPDPMRKRTEPVPRGEIPSPIDPPSGCRFHPRCPIAKDICSQVEPPLEEAEPGHYVACHFAGQGRV